MPFRPEEIIVHEDVDGAYQSWKTLASQQRRPAQAVWSSL
jgi:hypothetical protein